MNYRKNLLKKVFLSEKKKPSFFVQKIGQYWAFGNRKIICVAEFDLMAGIVDGEIKRDFFPTREQLQKVFQRHLHPDAVNEFYGRLFDVVGLILREERIKIDGQFKEFLKVLLSIGNVPDTFYYSFERYTMTFEGDGYLFILSVVEDENDYQTKETNSPILTELFGVLPE